MFCFLCTFGSEQDRKCTLGQSIDFWANLEEGILISQIPVHLHLNHLNDLGETHLSILNLLTLWYPFTYWKLFPVRREIYSKVKGLSLLNTFKKSDWYVKINWTGKVQAFVYFCCCWRFIVFQSHDFKLFSIKLCMKMGNNLLPQEFRLTLSCLPFHRQLVIHLFRHPFHNHDNWLPQFTF